MIIFVSTKCAYSMGKMIITLELKLLFHTARSLLCFSKLVLQGVEKIINFLHKSGCKCHQMSAQ